MKSVLLVTKYASPYKMQFFEELAQHCRLTVLFTEEIKNQKHRDASWFTEQASRFQAVQLMPGRFGWGGKKLCPAVFGWLRKPFDRIVIAGYENPTELAALIYCKLRHIPYFFEVDGGLLRLESSRNRFIKTRMISGAVGYLSSGPTATRYLCHYGAKTERVREYPFSSVRRRELCTAPADSQEKQRLREGLGMTERKILLSVGQFIPRKGYDLLFQSMRQLPRDIGLYIVGGEPTEEYLQMQRDWELWNVHFVGFCAHEALRDYYRAADVFVLPTREDIWGLVVNEAMACGLPVIATNRCGAGLDLITNGVSGYIVPVGDIAAMSRRIKGLLEADGAAFGKACIQRMADCTLENMAAVHGAILNGELPKA